MSKNKPKRPINTEEDDDQKIKAYQSRCKHKFTLIKLLDHFNDELIETGICKFCGYSPAY